MLSNKVNEFLKTSLSKTAAEEMQKFANSGTSLTGKLGTRAVTLVVSLGIVVGAIAETLVRIATLPIAAILSLILLIPKKTRAFAKEFFPNCGEALLATVIVLLTAPVSTQMKIAEQKKADRKEKADREAAAEKAETAKPPLNRRRRFFHKVA